MLHELSLSCDLSFVLCPFSSHLKIQIAYRGDERALPCVLLRVSRPNSNLNRFHVDFLLVVYKLTLT